MQYGVSFDSFLSTLVYRHIVAVVMRNIYHFNIMVFDFVNMNLEGFSSVFLRFKLI